MNKDMYLKDRLCKHFGAQNWFVLPEVIVVSREGISKVHKPITDIDVLGLKPAPNLSWELILGDCKTLKSQSPINRVLWLRGLMDVTTATQGIIVLQLPQLIDLDHKLVASNMEIALLAGSELDTYDKALIYPAGSALYSTSYQSLIALRNIFIKYQGLKPLCEFLSEFYWRKQERISYLRHIIGETIPVVSEIDPSKQEHLAFVLYNISMFSVALAECVGKVFNEYIQPQTQNTLDEALKVLIWGGRANYEFFSKLRAELLEAKKLERADLTLPAWETFLQLVRNMLEHPQLAFYIPQLLQKCAIDIMNNQPILRNASHDDLLLIKFAMLTTTYFCKAVKLPEETKQLLEEKFIQRQAEIVEQNTSVRNGSEFPDPGESRKE